MEPKEINTKKKKKQTIANVVFLIALTIMVLSLFLSFGEMDQIKDSLLNIFNGKNYIYIIIALVILILYYILYPVSIILFSKDYKDKISVRDSYLIGCSEHYYNSITPFASGGQPFQIYSYKRHNISTSDATGIVLVNFVAFELTLNIYGIISLFFFNTFVSSFETLGIGWMIYLVPLGFFFNFIFLVFIISLGTSKHIRNFLILSLKTICKINFIGKHLTKKIPPFEEYCFNYQEVFKKIWSNKSRFLLGLLSDIVDMGLFYLIPYFIMKAVGIDVQTNDILLVILGTSFASCAVCYIPTPGGTGGIEYAFAIVIASVTSVSSIGSANAIALLWRLLTYYIVLFVSFILNVILEKITRKKENLESENQTTGITK